MLVPSGDVPTPSASKWRWFVGLLVAVLVPAGLIGLDDPALAGTSAHCGTGFTDLIVLEDASGYVLLHESGNAFTWKKNGSTFIRQMGPLLPGERATGLVQSSDGSSTWMFTSRGRLFTSGNASHHGDLSALVLNGPVIDASVTPSGNGYYMVGSDGGVFAFGDARFYGSMGGISLNQPVTGMVPDPDGVGYWMVAGDGGVFSFQAPFRNSIPGVLAQGQTLNQPINGMISHGNAYLMVASDGGVFNFATNLPFLGSLGGNPPVEPIVAIDSVPAGYAMLDAAGSVYSFGDLPAGPVCAPPSPPPTSPPPTSPPPTSPPPTSPPPTSPPPTSPPPTNCELDGIPLYGSVYVTNLEFLSDFTIYETDVQFLADLNVYLTDLAFLATSCGIWYVTDLEFLSDFTVYVTDLEFLADLTVYYVNSPIFAG